MKQVNVGILGATGAVGQEMIKILEERNFPVASLRPIASARSAGSKIMFRGQECTIVEASDDAFEGLDIVLGAAENDIAERFAPSIVKAGAVFVDNSSAFRLDPNVPLVIPEINPEDVKYVLSSHYQGTPYDPYASYGARENRGVYRSIGINRNDFVALIQLRPDLPADLQAVEWVAYASNALNAMVPFYANVETTPAYLAGTTGEVSTDSFYWVSRMIAAMADASYGKSVFHVERYELGVLSACRALLNQYDAKQLAETHPARRAALRQEANEALAAEVKARAADTLDKVLFELSSNMKNAYSRSDM